MKVETLVATMLQDDFSLVKKMNIQSDAIVINQAEWNDFKRIKLNGYNVRCFTFSERGIGLSRNSALMRMENEIGLIADDDMIYEEGYSHIVTQVFSELPDADIIMFNVPVYGSTRPTLKITKQKRVSYFNALRYGAVNIAFKRESILKNNLYFSILFGGGSRYSSGEDSLFIFEALKKGLKIYATPHTIAKIYEKDSTWFRGYNYKYFYDKGALFQALGKNIFSYLLIVQYLIRKYKIYKEDISFYNAFKAMLDGRKDYKIKISEKDTYG